MDLNNPIQIWNTFADLIEFFEEGSRPLEYCEFLIFWDSMSTDEQWYFRTVRLYPNKTPNYIGL